MRHLNRRFFLREQTWSRFLLHGGFLVLTFLFLSSAAIAGIRDINFKEFAYPWDDSEEEPTQATPQSQGDEWGWITNPPGLVRLENGRHDFTEPGDPGD